MVFGRSVVPHSGECRSRIQKHLEQTECGRARLDKWRLKKGVDSPAPEPLEEQARPTTSIRGGDSDVEVEEKPETAVTVGSPAVMEPTRGESGKRAGDEVSGGARAKPKVGRKIRNGVLR